MLNKPSQSSILIDVRYYGEESQTHRHDYHQLVLPVSGVLELEIDGLQGKVSSEHAAVITADNRPAFVPNNKINLLSLMSPWPGQIL